MYTQIRLLLMEQSDQGLHYLRFQRYLLHNSYSSKIDFLKLSMSGIGRNIRLSHGVFGEHKQFQSKTLIQI